MKRKREDDNENNEIIKSKRHPTTTTTIITQHTPPSYQGEEEKQEGEEIAVDNPRNTNENMHMINSVGHNGSNNNNSPSSVPNSNSPRRHHHPHHTTTTTLQPLSTTPTTTTATATATTITGTTIAGCSNTKYDDHDYTHTIARHLPDELWQMCFSFLKTKDLLEMVCLTNRRFYRLIMQQPSSIWVSRDIVLRKACPPSALSFFRNCHIARFRFALSDAVEPVVSQQQDYLQHLVLAAAIDVEDHHSLSQYNFSSLQSIELYRKSPKTLEAILSQTRNLTSITFRHHHFDPFQTTNGINVQFEPPVLQGILNQYDLKKLSSSLPLGSDFLRQLVDKFCLEYLCLQDLSLATLAELSHLSNFKHLRHLKLKFSSTNNNNNANNQDQSLCNSDTCSDTIRTSTTIQKFPLEKLEYSCFINPILPNLLMATRDTLKELVFSLRYSEHDDCSTVPPLPNLKKLVLHKVGVPSVIQQLLTACNNGQLETLEIDMQDTIESTLLEPTSSVTLPNITNVYVNLHDCDYSVMHHVLSSCYMGNIKHLDLVGDSSLSSSDETLLKRALSRCMNLEKFEGNYHIFRCLPQSILPKLTFVDCYHDWDNEEEGTQYMDLDQSDIAIMSQCTSLTRLEVHNELVKSVAENWFSTILLSMPKLTRLSFSLGECECHVGNLIEHSTSLKTLYGSFDFSSENTKQDLIYLLNKLPSLETFGLSSYISLDQLFQMIPILNRRNFKRLHVRLRHHISSSNLPLPNVYHTQAVPYLKKCILHLEITLDGDMSLEDMVLVCMCLGNTSTHFSLCISFDPNRKQRSDTVDVNHLIVLVLKVLDRIDGLEPVKKQEIYMLCSRGRLPSCVYSIYDLFQRFNSTRAVN